jgi:hypothetical protein
VVGGVPVAGGDDEVEDAGVDQLVDAAGDRVAVRDRERAARGEVVLEVDDQERAGDVPIISGCGSTS